MIFIFLVMIFPFLVVEVPLFIYLLLLLLLFFFCKAQFCCAEHLELFFVYKTFALTCSFSHALLSILSLSLTFFTIITKLLSIIFGLILLGALYAI